MAKQQTNGIYKPKDKVKGRATKRTSTNKNSKKYAKPYRSQGR